MNFTLLTHPPFSCSEMGYWFFVHQGCLLIQKNQTGLEIPCWERSTAQTTFEEPPLFLGMLNEMPAYAAYFNEALPIPAGTAWIALRSLYDHLEATAFWVAARAVHLLHWDRRTRFCGACGKATAMMEQEMAKICSACGEIQFPRIAPAIIVAVVKDDQILLAHAGRFASGMYSVLAGFVEAGESLEECVHREVMEEVGIRIQDLCYFASQPWPFPDSLMVAFTARYQSGEIRVDGNEILDAGWFDVDHLPDLPGRISVARRLIDWFIESRRANPTTSGSAG